MNRRIAAITMGFVLALAAGACSSDQTTQASTNDAPTTTAADMNQAQKEAAAKLPTAESVVRVPVTKPATPTSIDPATLPERARGAGQLAGLTNDEKVCVNFAIKQALDKDPSIMTVEGKLAGLEGSAVVACAGAQRTAQLFAKSFSQQTPMTDEQTTCFVKAVTATPTGAADLISSLLTANISAIAAQLKPIESKCGVQLLPAMPG